VYGVLSDMIRRKIPVDGLGMQFHITSDFNDFAGLKANMERFGQLGLDIHITELDISVKSWDDAAKAQQAKVYANILKICLEVPACKNFETWGFTDKYTWKGTDAHPLPFDENLQAKAAVTEMLSILGGGSPPSPAPAPSPERSYEALTGTCQKAVAISGLLNVGSVAECQAQCDHQSGCLAVDTDGQDCYLKSHCDGQAGQCSGWCGYRVKAAIVYT